jgi:hypothetical protein
MDQDGGAIRRYSVTILVSVPHGGARYHLVLVK